MITLSRRSYSLSKYYRRVIPYLRQFSLSAVCLKSPKSIDDIPGPRSVPIFGTLYQYLPIVGHYRFDSLHLNGFKKLEKFGPIVREQIVPGVNLIWLFKPEDIETLFRTEGKYPERRSHLALEKYRLDRPVIYNNGGLLPTNGPEWLRIRRIIQKGLSNINSVQNFLPNTNLIIDEWIERLDELSHETINDYLPELSRLYLEILGMTTFDVRLDSFSKTELRKRSRSSTLIKSALDTNSCILKTDNGPQLWRKFDTPLYRKLQNSQKYMEQVAIDLLANKMSLFQEKDASKSVSLLESYLSSPELDLKDIIGMACDFLLAGIDTTTYTTSFMFYHIANNQRAQKELYKECVALLPQPNSPVTKDVLSEAQYAKAVLKESLRLNPVSVGVGRVLTKDVQFSGCVVPSGTVVVSQNQVCCRLEEHFQAPNEFIPERWLKSSSSYKSPHPFLLLPFGHGARSCIARRLAEQNMLVVLMKAVRNFKIAWNGEELDAKSLLINKPNKEVTLIFQKRQL